MITRRFKFNPHADRGPGWEPAWADGIVDTVDSLQAAHDALEHFPGRIGTFEDEMLSFGQMFFIRVDGHMEPDRELLDGQSLDIQEFLSFVLQGDQTLEAPPPRAYRLLAQARADELWEGPGQVFEKLEFFVRRAVSRCIKSHWLSDSMAEKRRRLPERVADRIMAWQLLGYEMAVKRWERNRLHAYQVADLFRATQDGFESIAFEAERIGYEGDLILNINCREHQVRWRAEKSLRE